MPRITETATGVRITASLLSPYDLMVTDATEEFLRSDGWYVTTRNTDTVSMEYTLVMEKGHDIMSHPYLVEVTDESL